MFSISLTYKGHLLLVVFYGEAIASFQIPNPNGRNMTVVLLLMHIFGKREFLLLFCLHGLAGAC